VGHPAFGFKGAIASLALGLSSTFSYTGRDSSGKDGTQGYTHWPLPFWPHVNILCRSVALNVRELAELCGGEGEHEWGKYCEE